MKTVASREIQTKFGSIANTVKSGETVVVTQYGQPTMMIVPYAMGQEMLRAHYAQRMTAFLDALRPETPAAPDLSDEDITRLVHELRP